MSTDALSTAGLPAVELLIPATWNRLDLDPATRTLSIARLVERTTKPGAEFDEARERMRAEFEKAAEVGAASGATLAFVHWSVADGKIASASLFVALIDARAVDQTVSPEPLLLAEALAARNGGEVRQLATGPGTRVRRRGRAPGTSAAESGPEAEIITWYVPHFSARRLAVLTFSTPNLELAEEFDGVFDTLADTLRWTA